MIALLFLCNLSQSGKWMALSDEQSKILALEAKMSKFGGKGPRSSSTTASPSSGSTSTQRTSSSRNSRGNNRQGKKTIPTWMTQWPGRAFVENNQPKVKDGKTYYWCKKHKRFCMHKTSECRLTNQPSSQGGSQSTNSTSSTTQPAYNSNSNPSIRVSTATMMNE